MQTNTSESLPRTIPELLENHTIQVQPQGYSMYPLFVPGRDSAVIEKADCDSAKKVMSFYTAGERYTGFTPDLPYYKGRLLYGGR